MVQTFKGLQYIAQIPLGNLDNALVIFKIEQDESGNYVDRQWLWK
jgi:hypothetical protein